MIDKRLIRIASDPVRLQALNLLNERSAAVSEVAEELAISVLDAGRHLDEMDGEGLIEVVGEVLSRGAVEPRYRALVRTLFDGEEFAAFTNDERRRLTGWIVGMIEADVHEALARGSFTARSDAHASRTVPIVDEQGWEELVRIHEEALKSIFAVEAAAAERLAETGEAGFPALAALLCCELPPRPGQPPS